jgi:RNA polymerase primary sigma factor
VTEGNRKAIRYFQENGGRFTIISGRHPLFLKTHQEGFRVNAPLAGYNGALIIDENDGNVLYSGGRQDMLALELAEANREEAFDEGLFTRILNLSLSRVVEIAQEYVGSGVLLLDLIQEGSLGLWQGILSFQRGDFRSHAAWWIRQYLHKAVLLQARESGLGVKMKQAMEDYRSVDEKLLADLGRNPTVEEIAEEMHMTAQEAQMVADMLSAAQMLSSAKQEMEEPEETPEDEQHVEDTAYFQSRQRVNDLLEGLNDTEAKLIALRFGLEGGKSLSTEETGRKLGLTPEEVVALETAALSKMRNTIPS